MTIVILWRAGRLRLPGFCLLWGPAKAEVRSLATSWRHEDCMSSRRGRHVGWQGTPANMTPTDGGISDSRSATCNQFVLMSMISFQIVCVHGTIRDVDVYPWSGTFENPGNSRCWVMALGLQNSRVFFRPKFWLPINWLISGTGCGV